MSYQTPRGTNDILPKDIEKWHKIEDVIDSFVYYMIIKK